MLPDPDLQQIGVGDQPGSHRRGGIALQGIQQLPGLLQGLHLFLQGDAQAVFLFHGSGALPALERELQLPGLHAQRGQPVAVHDTSAGIDGLQNHRRHGPAGFKPGIPGIDADLVGHIRDQLRQHIRPIPAQDVLRGDIDERIERIVASGVQADAGDEFPTGLGPLGQGGLQVELGRTDVGIVLRGKLLALRQRDDTLGADAGRHEYQQAQQDI